MATYNSPIPNGPVTVWVCPPVALNADGSTASAAQVSAAQAAGTPLSYYFPFSNASAWRQEPALIPEDSEETASSLGSASFRLMRQTRMDVHDNQPMVYPSVIIGSYVAIVTAAKQLTFTGTATCLWKGWITRIDAEQVAGSSDIIGTVTASELGTLLDRQQVVGWTRDADGKGIYGESSPMQSPPTANMGNPTGAIVGNAVNTQLAWLFARIPAQFGYAVPGMNGYTGSDLGKYWTRYRLLKHVTQYCVPKALCISMPLLMQDGSQTSFDPTDVTTIAGYLNQTQFPEVFDLRNLTWRGMLDMLVPRERDLGWVIRPTDAGAWQIYIYSLAQDNSYGVPPVPGPQQIPAILSFYPVERVAICQDASDLPDKVVMEGNPIVFCFTVSGQDKNFGVGWNTALNSNYFTGAGPTNQTLYNSLLPDARTDLDRQYRAQPWMRDVFTRYAILPDSNSGDLRIPGTPGMGNSLQYPACPQLSWKATVTKIFGGVHVPTTNTGLAFDQGANGSSAMTSRMPYLGGIGLLRTLPMLVGFDSKLVDHRAAQQRAAPVYMPVRLYYYNVNDLYGILYRDLTVPNIKYGSAVPSVEVDDRGAALRIEYAPKELLAKAVWPTDGSAVAAEIDPSKDDRAMDYSGLVATIAMESDQKVRVQVFRPGLKTTDDSQVRRTLRIVNPNLNCHAIWSGTIIGITIPTTGSTGNPTPDRIADTNMMPVPGSSTDGLSFLRNDFGLCDLLCNQAAGWAFRPRRAISITMLQPAGSAANGGPLNPTIASIGILITNTVDGSVTTTVGTVVEKIQRSYGAKPRLTIQTSLPPMPNFAAAGMSASPTGGGPVSAALSGTPTQAIQAIRDDVVDLQQKTVKVPIFNQVPLAAAPLLRVKIVGGQIVNTIHVVQYAADPFTADKVYNPTIDTAYIVGLGYGRLYNAQGQDVGPVIVRHNYTAFSGSLPGGRTFTVGPAVSIPVTGGGIITVYPIIDG